MPRRAIIMRAMAANIFWRSDNALYVDQTFRWTISAPRRKCTLYDRRSSCMLRRRRDDLMRLKEGLMGASDMGEVMGEANALAVEL